MPLAVRLWQGVVMAFVAIEPRYRAQLQALGLKSAADFLELRGHILSGHPDRHVLHVQLGSGETALSAFLKREHYVRWRERLGSGWRGLGFVSQSCREAHLLGELRKAGIACPESLASGEDDRGRAFLLLRALPETRELRAVLREHRMRRQLCRELGRALARVHQAGFSHPDLCSKHILIDVAGKISILDWQRCRRWRRASIRQRARDLALLHATIADELASARERLACLAAYLHACSDEKVRRRWRSLVTRIECEARRQRRRPKVRAMLQPPLPAGAQELVWLDGEALCVTRAFLEEQGGRLPAWLAGAAPRASGPETHFTRLRLAGKPVELVRRWASRPLTWLWCCLRRWRMSTPEVKQAGTVFLLQRYGITTPRLLAVGQRFPRPWQTESFLLTETLMGSTSLSTWLEERCDSDPKIRRRVLRAAGHLLRRLHDAAYYLMPAGEENCPLAVQDRAGQEPTVAVGELAGIQRLRRAGQRRARADVASVARMLASVGCNRADRVRFFLGYHGMGWLTAELRPLCRKVLGATSRAREKRTSL